LQREDSINGYVNRLITQDLEKDNWQEENSVII
jgi:hypothetical protein